MDAEQRARWKHVGSKERRAVMSFLMDDLGLSAVESADFLTATTEKQEEVVRRVLAKMSELKETGDVWKQVYEEQKAHEAIPVAFHRTFLAVWGTQL